MADTTKDILSQTKKEYAKIKIKLKGIRSYYIHDNYEKPVLVYIDTKKFRAHVYKRNSDVKSILDTMDDDEYNKKKYYTKEVDSFKYSEVFIGKSPKNNTTKFSGGHGKEFNGNTILFKIGKNKYRHVTNNRIYTFTPKEHINEFYSLIGNNDVPYPFALTNDYAYLLIENKYISKSEFDIIENIDWTDTIRYYYDNFYNTNKAKKDCKYFYN